MRSMLPSFPPSQFTSLETVTFTSIFSPFRVNYQSANTHNFNTNDDILYSVLRIFQLNLTHILITTYQNTSILNTFILIVFRSLIFHSLSSLCLTQSYINGHLGCFQSSLRSSAVVNIRIQAPFMWEYICKIVMETLSEGMYGASHFGRFCTHLRERNLNMDSNVR